MRLLVGQRSNRVELSRSLMSLGEVIALGRDHCDFVQPPCLPDIIRGIKPEVIVNAAAYTAVDKAEQEEALALTVNGKSFALASARRAAMASSNKRRCPTGLTPRIFKSSAVNLGRSFSSIAFSRNAAS
jgi:dTDP-4-dehydrorhamnose reductase